MVDDGLAVVCDANEGSDECETVNPAASLKHGHASTLTIDAISTFMLQRKLGCKKRQGLNDAFRTNECSLEQ